MSGLPEGWAHTTLGEIVSPRGEKALPVELGDARFIGMDNIEAHTSRLIETKPVSEFKSAVSVFKKGDILYGRLRPYLNKVYEAGFDGAASAEFIVFPESPAVERRFLALSFRDHRFVKFASQRSTGDRPRVSFESVSDYRLSLPPRAEQRRIIAKLDSLFESTRRAREELSHIPRLIENYKKAILEAAFRGDLTREWREKNGLPSPEEVTLGNVSDGFSYGSSAKSSPTGTIPVLRMGNIQNMALDWTDLVYTSNAQEIEKYTLVEGDVLFNRTNSPELVGKTALYQGEQPAIYAGYLIRIRCGNHLLPKYINYCLNGPMGREYCWRVKSDGVSQSNINAKKLAAFSFLLPTREEQAEIIRRIEKAMDWLSVVDGEQGQAAHLLDRLDQANLAKAFRGELVPQDPKDEPASVLMERIRLERPARAEVRTPGRGRDAATRTGVSKRQEQTMGKKRIDVTPAYLSEQLRALGGTGTAQVLWQRSDMDIDEFYKQLRDEMDAGLIREGEKKEILELADAA